MLSFNIIMEA